MVVRIAVAQTVESQIAVTPAAVPILAVLSAASLFLVPVAVRNAVIHDVVPSVAAQSAAIQFWFQVVIRVAPIVARTAALISVPYAARCVVVNPASRVHAVPHDDSRVTAL